MKLERNSIAIKNLTEFLIENKKSFQVKHGTYTTTIETEHGKRKFQTNTFDNRVFIAARMIRRDVLASEIGREIMDGKHSKINFGHHQNLSPFKAKKVLNLDISSAYASCLHLSGLITQNTYDYLKTVRKEERLPSIGMLARSQCIWTYEYGVCTEVKPTTADTAQIFYYLIEQINLTMEAIAWILGKHYFFYWVDGVFFSADTPKRLITQAERVLNEKGYRFKYEEVTNFSLKKLRNDTYMIDMIKNNEPKKYHFSTTNREGRQIKEFLTMISNSSQ